MKTARHEQTARVHTTHRPKPIPKELPKGTELLAEEAKKSSDIQQFTNKLQETKQWGEQRHKTKGFPQLSALSGEAERYKKWYAELSPKKRALEDLYESYRNIPSRGITIEDFYNKAQAPAVDALTPSAISQFGIGISIRVGDHLLTVELNNIREAQGLAGRLRRFVKSHRVAIEPEAVQNAVQTCAAIKII